jgi:DNA replication and repair protein RecF
MSLETLAIEDFRCVERAHLDFDPRCNVIFGGNASGKTSLLEAIFFLGRGRSFRSSRNELLIRTGAPCFMLQASIRAGGPPRLLGIRFGPEGIEGRHGGERIGGVAELAVLFPVQAIDPEVHRLVDGGPQERRRFLDWGVFHVEPSFVNQWRRFQRALRQRNAALRAGESPAAVQAWDPELAETGEAVARHRQSYVDGLRLSVMEIGQRLLGGDVEVGLHRGWSADRSLGDALAQSFSRDRERGLTHVGPHRADLTIGVHGQPARDRVSRGQQKLLAATLLLGQLAHDAAKGASVAALLVDDPAAELDLPSLGRMIDEVLPLPVQLFLTALDAENPVLARLPEGRRFHVEHGQVRALI